MKIALWIVQALLAVAFGMAGTMKAFTPGPELIEAMPWVGEAGLAVARIAGFAELAGAIGLILPAVTRIKPSLTAWAGVGLATVMVLAAGFHLTRGELFMLAPNSVLGAMAAFVAWGRFRKAPITPRSARGPEVSSATA
jgi:hypothetical protein